ncbi:MAG: hypothetical protein H0W39_00965 [Sphingomonas sp.]|nr:hypothetical protein [Sphingomonas sp.]
MAVLPINEIFRDYVVDGVPSSGAHKPRKVDIRDTLNVTGTHTFPGAGAIPRSISVNLNKFPTPDDYGADPTGVADSLAAINAALVANDIVYVKDTASYKASGAIPLSRIGHALLGDGNGQGSITSTSLTANLITLANGISSMKVGGLSLLRSVVPTAGIGVACLGSTDRSELFDLHIEGQYIGLQTSTCDEGRISRVTSKKNILDGWLATCEVAYGAAQWEVNDILLAQNGRDGVRAQSVLGSAGMILGTWNSLKTFGNTGRGVILLGSATTPVFDMRLNNPFIGSDGTTGIYIDAYGGKHVITGGFIERCGMDPTGPAYATPASNNAPGVQIAGNETNAITLVGVLIDNNSLVGIRSASGQLSMAGCQVLNNGLALVAGQRSGISIDGGSAAIVGGKSGNTGGGTSQQYGVAIGVDAVTMAGVDLKNNAVLPVFKGVTLTAANSSLAGNTPITPNTSDFPYRIEGTATFDPVSLADGAGVTTTVTVTGAALGDMAMASFSLATSGITITAWVSAANTVSVRFQNETAGVLDIASGTLKAWVLK